LLDEIRAREREEGRREGQDEGRREGHEEGKAAGMALSVLAVLDARGIAMGEADRALIRGERDRDTLGRWVAQAAGCESVTELVG
jgi:hypothetical protein